MAAAEDGSGKRAAWQTPLPAHIREVRDREMLGRFLAREPVRTAYLLGDLDPLFFPYARYFVYFGEKEPLAVAMRYDGLSAPALLTYGSTDHVPLLLAALSHRLPSRVYVHLPEEHAPAYESLLGDTRSLRRMARLGLDRSRFVPPADLTGVSRATHADTADIIDLYRFYPDSFFEPYHLETGYYFVARDEGRVVSVAGVHAVSFEHDIGVLGNIVTHPDFRGRGHSTNCTGRLVEELFLRLSRLALNVSADNDSARSVYARLGFVDDSTFYEGLIDRS